jgi:phosphatidylserine decarboxylase
MTQKQLGTLLQYITPQHALSWFAGWLSTRRWHWLKSWEIRYFINRYNVDLSAALESNPEVYPDFNSFFTRYLKPDLRPIVAAADAIACPADGCVSQMGPIETDRLLQAKGFYFTLSALLGGSDALAHEFQDGQFSTIYLSPKDYHRVHMPFTGTLRETVFIPGDLFSVNQQTAREVPNLFARNERLVCIFDTDIGPMAVILVGAMLVGSMATVWEKNSPTGKTITRKAYPQSGSDRIRLERGAELGYFKMGSTVITLFSKEKITWAPELTCNSTTQMGQLLAKISLP